MDDLFTCLCPAPGGLPGDLLRLSFHHTMDDAIARAANYDVIVAIERGGEIVWERPND